MIAGALCRVCPRAVAQGAKLCERCAADYVTGESHPVGCACGPCAVYSIAAMSVSYAASSPEVMRARSAQRQPESLSAYLARRDASGCQLVVDVPGEEASRFLHAVTTLAARELQRDRAQEPERAVWVRLCSARLENGIVSTNNTPSR